MQAELVMIGTELLLGELVDTNATTLARMLREIGLDLYYKTTVGDNERRIADVLHLALNRSDIVITSGGLGPTVDDVTRQAAARATGRRLVHSPELEKQIEARFRAFGRQMAENNRQQAYIPEGAVPLPNPVGTAPCFLSEDSQGRGCVIALPGVPRELEYMMNHTVIPLLIERMGGAKAVKVRILRTCAVGESNVDRAIRDLMSSPNPTVGLAAHAGQTDVRITAKADSEAEADALIAGMEATLRERLGVAVYGTDKDSVPAVVGELLAARGLSVGIVDTLTGGELARELRDAGFGELIKGDWHPAGLVEAVTALLPGVDLEQAAAAPQTLTAQLAQAAAPPDGLGLALAGPFPGDETFIVVYGREVNHISRPGRHYQASDYSRRWLVIQGFDWLRRVLLGQLSSPADWQMADEEREA